MVKFLLDNYCGPKLFRLQMEAYKAAEVANEWYVMELVEKYEKPPKIWA